MSARAVFRGLWELVKLRLQWEIAFRVDALLGLLASLLSLVGGILLFDITLHQVSSIGGWIWPQMLALVGTWSLLTDLERGLLRGYRNLPGLVHKGHLELYLLRPLPAPLLLVGQGIDPGLIWRLPLDLAVIIYAIGLAAPPLHRILLYSLACVVSLGIYAFMAFSLLCLSFWVIQIGNLSYMVYDLTEFARYPATVYRGVARLIFSTVLPFLVLANIPVQILFGAGIPPLLLHQALVLLGFTGLAWALWRAGLHKYQGAST